ncbi:hypothetical protein B0O99DRAFT_600453 [Bisporella sp. PMI_857]|nr:hypothetical protein B0O99DRAFT_600453 [Bisporella sp. PMI_857]
MASFGDGPRTIICCSRPVAQLQRMLAIPDDIELGPGTTILTESIAMLTKLRIFDDLKAMHSPELNIECVVSVATSKGTTFWGIDHRGHDIIQLEPSSTAPRLEHLNSAELECEKHENKYFVRYSVPKYLVDSEKASFYKVISSHQDNKVDLATALANIQCLLSDRHQSEDVNAAIDIANNQVQDIYKSLLKIEKGREDRENQEIAIHSQAKDTSEITVPTTPSAQVSATLSSSDFHFTEWLKAEGYSALIIQTALSASHGNKKEALGHLGYFESTNADPECNSSSTRVLALPRSHSKKYISVPIAEQATIIKGSTRKRKRPATASATETSSSKRVIRAVTTENGASSTEKEKQREKEVVERENGTAPLKADVYPGNAPHPNIRAEDGKLYPAMPTRAAPGEHPVVGRFGFELNPGVKPVDWEDQPNATIHWTPQGGILKLPCGRNGGYKHGVAHKGKIDTIKREPVLGRYKEKPRPLWAVIGSHITSVLTSADLQVS